jgi:hypothetical protein
MLINVGDPCQSASFSRRGGKKKKPLKRILPKVFFFGEKRHKVSPYFKGKNKFRILLLIFGYLLKLSIKIWQI